MADIGVLPSKTSISITSSNGENGTIPAASPKAAGCMTAEHSRQLETLWTLHQTEGQTEAVVIQAPAPSRPVDAVTRGELRMVVAEMQRSIAANAAPQTPLAIAHDTGLEDRLVQMEAREMQQEARIQSLAQTLDTALAFIEQMQKDLGFVEQNAVVAVQVEETEANKRLGAAA